VTEETVTVSGRAQEISRLNQAAANAMMLGQMIAPAGDNALDYYEQVLALDAYDTTAYQGKKQIADRLRESYNLLVSEAKFDKALNVISRLQRIEPLNMQNDALVSGLEKAIALHVKKVRESGSAEQVAQTSAVMDNIGNKLKSSNTASKALKKEKQLLGRIQAAFTDDNIVPPTKDNAYTLVSDALKANSISKANITPIVKQLNDRLVSAAESEFAANEEADIAKFLALIKRLNVDPASIAELNQLVVEREALLLARAAAAEAEKANGEGEEGEAEEAETDTPKIIPAKIISRAPPRYPTKAVNKQVEGWVEIKFIIDEAGVPINIKVTDSKPKDIFNSAAIKAVQKWRFSPARNEETGLPVESETTITKVQFKLE
jgi:TonB family protein